MPMPEASMSTHPKDRISRKEELWAIIDECALIVVGGIAAVGRHYEKTRPDQGSG